MDTTPRPKNHDFYPVELDERWIGWEDAFPTDIASTLELAGTHTIEAAARIAELAAELDQRLDHHRPHVAVDLWLAQDATHAERLDRRATLATLERLGHHRAKPLPWPGWSAPTVVNKRLLTATEWGLVRLHARTFDARRVAAIALLEAGATSGELHQVTAAILDGYQVQLPGTRRTRARTIVLHPWAHDAIDMLVAAIGPDELVCYSGDATDPATIQSSVLMNVDRVLDQSGVGADPTVRPMSLNYTGLRHIYDTQGWDACVAAAGVKNWERLRSNIGLR